MEYYSAIKKNTFESVLMRWMKLKPIIQSEVSQNELKLFEKLLRFEGKRASQAALVVKNLPANAGDKRPMFNPWIRKIPWKKEQLYTPVF